jgi:glycosyltransferase involved in cell wall biosynthesis
LSANDENKQEGGLVVDLGDGSSPRSGRSQHPDKVTVSVVIPALNEARNIGWVLERLPACVDEVILVDGHSTDGTVEVARRIRPDVRAIAQRGRGKGDALRTGFAAARGDCVVMIDADGSMDPAEIDRCLGSLETHAIVKGSRFAAGGGTADMELYRRLGNRLLLGLVNLLYGASFTDLCYGLFAFRRDQLDKLELRSDGFEIETEIVVRALRAGIDIGEVPSFEAPRRFGSSNLHTWSDGRRVLRTLLRERFVAATGRANGRSY